MYSLEYEVPSFIPCLLAAKIFHCAECGKVYGPEATVTKARASTSVVRVDILGNILITVLCEPFYCGLRMLLATTGHGRQHSKDSDCHTTAHVVPHPCDPIQTNRSAHPSAGWLHLFRMVPSNVNVLVKQ